ncbi:tRNA-(ms[2]io[6]A)-hydroxylase [Legionella dresdenensis]|uniref:tRNA-(Ms[2]io[6]A)-hydroxylase n=1 Tax=Legionella dresdenensis TaxID=450200 RepID=A0ABV8CCG3_9GAMM
MLNALANDLQTLNDFIRLPTPDRWLAAVADNLPLLLVDHAHCERKAAATAINLISKYPHHKELVALMSPLAREEMLHFEKVIDLMQLRGIKFGSLTPSDYAQQLHALATRANNQERLRDLLLIGAIIEARSCERFCALVPILEDKVLARFYSTLLKSEARHYQDYLHLANLYGEGVEERLDCFLKVENRLISAEDSVFRFHSGVPALPN